MPSATLTARRGPATQTDEHSDAHGRAWHGWNRYAFPSAYARPLRAAQRASPHACDPRCPRAPPRCSHAERRATARPCARARLHPRPMMPSFACADDESVTAVPCHACPHPCPPANECTAQTFPDGSVQRTHCCMGSATVPYSCGWLHAAVGGGGAVGGSAGSTPPEGRICTGALLNGGHVGRRSPGRP